MVKPINLHLQGSTYAVQFVEVVLVGEEDGEEEQEEQVQGRYRRIMERCVLCVGPRFPGGMGEVGVWLG